jgi:hypothetical protein
VSVVECVFDDLVGMRGPNFRNSSEPVSAMKAVSVLVLDLARQLNGISRKVSLSRNPLVVSYPIAVNFFVTARCAVQYVPLLKGCCDLSCSAALPNSTHFHSRVLNIRRSNEKIYQ